MNTKIEKTADPPEGKLAWNEQVKLLAAFLNAGATALLTLWLLAPVAAFIYGGGQSSASVWTLIAAAPIGLAGAVALHIAARRVLRRLRE